MPKRLTVWVTTNCGKSFKRWEYQATWAASWEICMQVKKQQLELDMEQRATPHNLAVIKDKMYGWYLNNLSLAISINQPQWWVSYLILLIRWPTVPTNEKGCSLVIFLVLQTGKGGRGPHNFANTVKLTTLQLWPWNLELYLFSRKSWCFHRKTYMY